MIVSGRWVCFNCKTDGQPMYETNAAGQRIKIKLGVTMRALKVYRKGRFGGKGKLVGEATVCQNCYDLGHNKVPFGSFNGYIPAPKPMPPEIAKKLEEAKRKAELGLLKPLPLQPKSPPSSPASSSQVVPPSPSPDPKYKPQEK